MFSSDIIQIHGGNINVAEIKISWFLENFYPLSKFILTYKKFVQFKSYIFLIPLSKLKNHTQIKT
jgi:hypothetical protein